jgi:molecular chaperone HtpG
MSVARASETHAVSPRAAGGADPAWAPLADDVVLGKDVLELLSTSMYVDPMTIYREYVQNAADAVDQARSGGLLGADEKGLVSIHVDAAARSARIKDNGTGIAWGRFGSQLTALGGSQKRGTGARGFRGVGRLAGLGYCQELIFRSRVDDEGLISEMRWDCRRLQAALRATDYEGGLAEIVRHAVTIRRVKAQDEPARFFEVELRGVVRHRNDRLLSGPAIADYLAQVAPVPFHPEFALGAEISSALGPRVSLGAIELTVSGIDGPVYRPHRDRFAIGEIAYDAFSSLEFFEIPGVDGGIAAVGWVLHHGYTGAIPQDAGIKGLRLRVGNIQVGDNNLLEELFPETRFNAWAVGELHILDPRVVPNGRRDHFHPNVHYSNINNHIAPVARDIARRCRTSSIRRKWLREFELERDAAQAKLGILKQGSLGAREQERVVQAIRQSLATMAKIAGMDLLEASGSGPLMPMVDALRRKLEKAQGAKLTAEPLARLPAAKRRVYEQMFELIYECSANQVAAKALVDRILLKIG